MLKLPSAANVNLAENQCSREHDRCSVSAEYSEAVHLEKVEKERMGAFRVCT